MNDYIQTTKTYIIARKKALVISALVVVGIAVLVLAITLFINNSTPKIVYQPANACDLLTPKKAQELLGSASIHSNVQTPVISDDTAVSKCGYTDGNPDVNNMIVAAIIVRSGINDKGTEKNKTEFDAGRPADNVEDVKQVGDKAYFNRANGQLNVLRGHDWIIFSYGTGASPSTNTLEDAVKLSSKVLQKSV